jgi:arylesterase/paraoxonase
VASWLRVAAFWATALLVPLAAGVLDLVMDAGAMRRPAPRPATCRRVEGVLGAEDMVFDAASRRVYIARSDWRGLRAGRPAEGGLQVWDLDAARGPVTLETDLVGPLNAHGLDLARGPDGALRLFVVNHPTATTSRVEIFAVTGPARARHVETVASPAMISLNDVAAVDERRFYATNDAGTRPDEPLRTLETFGRLPWASVLWFDGRRVEVAATGLVYANGIALSADRRVVFVTETTGQRLRAFDRDRETGHLAPRADLGIPSALDNVSVAPSGRLWIASHPRSLDFLAHARDASRLSPSQVFVVDPARRRATEVWNDDGRLLSGSSVALPVGAGRVLIGSVFERHILDCRL